MPTVVCPGCGRRIGIPDEEMDLTIQCARCVTRFKPAEVPQRAKRVRVICPDCQTGFRISLEMVGRRISCPKCQHAFEAVAGEPGTITAACPGCGRAIPLWPHELSKTVHCARCNTHFRPAQPRTVPPEIGDKEEHSGRLPDEGYRSGAKPNPGLLVGSVILGGLVGGATMCFPALVLSQYWPVFGGVLERGLAVPWSPARISLIPIHLFVFGLVGCLFGGALGLLVAQSRWRV
jgi:predicted Zn finger-like uncharacterized protein